MARLRFHDKGVYKTKAGHLRFSSPRELKGKYVHRYVVEKLIEETPYSIRLLLPWPYEVHHADFNKEHNEPANFILLSNEFHSWITASGQRARNFQPKWKPAPDWVLFREEDAANEVPF